ATRHCEIRGREQLVTFLLQICKYSRENDKHFHKHVRCHIPLLISLYHSLSLCLSFSLLVSLSLSFALPLSLSSPAPPFSPSLSLSSSLLVKCPWPPTSLLFTPTWRRG